MLNLVSDGDTERVQLSVWRTIGAVVGNLIPIAVLPFVMCKKVIYDGSGTIPGMEGVFHNKPAAMGGAPYEIGDVMLSPLTGEKAQVLLGARAFWVVLLLGVIGFIAITFMIKNLTLRADEHSFAGDNGAEKSNLLKGCGRFLKNRPAFGASVAAMGVLLCMYAATTANAILFATYFGMAQWSGVVQAIAFLPMILFMPFITKIVHKFGKKEASSVGTIVSMIGGAVMLIFPLVGKSAGLVVYLLGLVIFGLGMGVYVCVSWAMVADAIDYHEWKFGLREEGTVYALHSFFRNVAQSAGPALVLLLMGALGYVSELGTIGQNAQTAANMTWLVAGLYMLSAIFQFVGVTLIYNLDKKTLAQMRADLAASRRR
jgi:GPH family glycoside/pentoside/hexuronide:cation symporter